MILLLMTGMALSKIRLLSWRQMIRWIDGLDQSKNQKLELVALYWKHHKY